MIKIQNLVITVEAYQKKNLGMDVLNLEGDVCVETIVDAAILLKKKDMIELGLYDENFFSLLFRFRSL